MKKVIMLCLIVALSACQTMKQPKVFYPENDRVFPIGYDSLWDKLTYDLVKNGISIKMSDKANGIILTEESLNEEQTYKYTDYDSKKSNSNLKECNENLLIILKPDAGLTNVDIKSIPTCTVEIRNWHGKISEIVIKKIECQTTGAREKELLDFLSINK